MASKTRQAQRLQEQIEERLRKDIALEMRGLQEAVDEGKRVMAREIGLREATINEERLKRVSAQRGYIDRLSEPCVHCGQKWWSGEIGYNPDADPLVLKEIEEGLIPPRGIPLKVLMADRRVESEETRMRRELRVKLTTPPKQADRPRPPRRIRRLTRKAV